MHSRSPKSLAEIKNQRLIECITLRRLYKLRLMLEEEENELNVDCFDDNHMTPLMIACSMENEKAKTRENIIRMLLKRGANPNIVDGDGMTVLANACKRNNLGVVKTLLNRASVDIDFNIKDRHGDTCLMHAVRTSNTELVKLLVNTMQRLSIDIDVKNNTDITPYLEAKRIGLYDIANILTQYGNACQSLMICPLIFDEYKEDAYNAAITTREDNFRSSKGRKNEDWPSRKITSRHRRVKSALERRVDSGRLKGSGSVEKKIYSDNEANGIKQESRKQEFEFPRELFSNKDTLKKFNVKDSKRRNTITVTNGVVKPLKDIQSEMSDSKNKGNTKCFERNIINEEIDSVSECLEPAISVEINPNDTNSTIEDIQPHFKISEVSTGNGDSKKDFTEQADCETAKSKNTWLKRLQKRTPMWKQRLQIKEKKEGFESEARGEDSQEDVKIYRQSTLSSGAMRMLWIDKPNTPFAPRRCSSNLSVYFSGSQHLMPTTRPGSAYNLQEKPDETLPNSYKNQAAQEPVKTRITYEEIFELCPEMKDDAKRKWYSDIRWMLALKAQQNSGSYLPAQPQRYPQDSAESDFRNDSEGSRTSRRISSYDVKRPTIKKRHTTLSPTVLKEFNEEQ